MLILLGGAVWLLGRRITARELLTKACPRCEGPVQEAYFRCPHCGDALKKNCPGCSRVVEQAWEYCPFCSETLKNKTKHPTTAQKTDQLTS